MLDNLPVLSHKHGDLTVEGYSRAAVQSYWRVPELKLGFDLGGSPWDFVGTSTIFVTHAHLDHMAALPVYVARRRMMKMEPPTIYLPAEIVERSRRDGLPNDSHGSVFGIHDLVTTTKIETRVSVTLQQPDS